MRTDKDRSGSGAATRSLSIAIWEPDPDLTDVCAKLNLDSLGGRAAATIVDRD